MIRAVAALFIAIASIFTYCTGTSENPVTGEKQRVGLTIQQEVAVGQQAIGPLMKAHGGLLPNQKVQDKVDEIGAKLVSAIGTDLPYHFSFHALNDPETVNAFALPGGQICITRALLLKLESESQLAAVLAHETSHVVARHSSEQVARQKLSQGLSGAAVIASYDPRNPQSQAQMAVLVAELTNMKFSRSDELEADSLGVKLLSDAGYRPEATLEVIQILEESSKGSPPEFLSTHPTSENREQKIREALDSLRSSRADLHLVMNTSWESKPEFASPSHN